MAIAFRLCPDLKASDFLELAKRVRPGDYDESKAQLALAHTINVTAWNGDRLVGCVRILTDGYFFGSIPEVLVDPDYQGRDIGTRLMEMAWEESPSSIFVNAEPGRAGFFEQLGYEKNLVALARRKKP